ncbi:MAG TPA: hypothetical protein VIE36_16480 [Methylomirabilota bacterium]|jgi:hypothetical protein
MKALWIALLGLAVALAGCANDTASEVSQRINEERVALSPASVTLAIGVLKGKLSDMAVIKRVNAETGEVVSPPQLRATLVLENPSEDQAVRVVSGRVGYLDKSGARIGLAEGRGEPTIQIYGYSGDRLDPGGTATHQLDVPFPAAALAGSGLAEVRVDLTYIPMPYRHEAGRAAVSVAPQS